MWHHIISFFVIDPGHTEVGLSSFTVLDYKLINKQLIFGAAISPTASFLFNREKTHILDIVIHFVRDYSRKCFNIIGRQEIGLKLSLALPLDESLTQRTVFPSVIQPGIDPVSNTSWT